MLNLEELVVLRIKEKITEKLEAEERSLRWFCKKNNINASVVSSWLSGKRDIRFSTFCRIAEAFHIVIDFSAVEGKKESRIKIKVF